MDLDPLVNNMSNKDTIGMDLDPESFGGEDYPTFTANEHNAYRFLDKPIITPEEEAAISKFYDQNPFLKNKETPAQLEELNNKSRDFYTSSTEFNDDAWIQTYSGVRFTPTNPRVDAIVIQDIAHSLSMQCRFTGHVSEFYSVAQHSVLVSYICDSKDAKWGLMHDASEAYLIDVPMPLKRSGKFQSYLDFEKTMQKAICKRFYLPEEEPESVKLADKVLLATEARDLMSPLREDWVVPWKALPFKIDPLPPKEAKALFMERFYELFITPSRT